jgi:S-adenosylmethionine:tRNA ribosyltransferase-isomerase
LAGRTLISSCSEASGRGRVSAEHQYIYTSKQKVELTKIDLREYNYELPPGRIARYPVEERDLSKVLVFKDNNISEDVFRNIDHYLPSGSLLVFNNTRVIRARILFRKESGASIEVLCLEPHSPADYEQSFGSREPVEWKCIVGNLRKWKSGIISTSFPFNGKEYVLTAEKRSAEGEAWRIRFDWGTKEISFGEVIELAGILPLPPYLEREAVDDDLKRDQTV